MGAGHVAIAILASGLAVSMTDWFFGGVLFHDRYLAYPEVWRRRSGEPGENSAVAWAVVLGFFTCAAFILAAWSMGIHGYTAAVRLAVAVWLMAPLPLLITNALFIKLHPLNVAANAVGWLSKLLIAAIAVGWWL